MIRWVRLFGVRWELVSSHDQFPWRYRRDGSDSELWVCWWRRKGRETWRVSLLQGGSVVTADGETMGGSLKQLEERVLGLVTAALPLELFAVDDRVLARGDVVGGAEFARELEDQMRKPLPEWEGE